MNVDIISSAMNLRAYSPRGKSESVVGVGKGNESRKAASVEISGTSSDAQKVKAALEDLPDVRLAVVENIRSRIKHNDYPIENNIDSIVKSLMFQDKVLA